MHTHAHTCARAHTQSVHITNEMLFEEIRHAKAEDQHKEDTERAKFQAVRQGVDYDQFEQNVKVSFSHAQPPPTPPIP